MRVLLISPTCNGGDVGEAWVSYQWASRLADRHDVTLLTYHKFGAPPASLQFSNLEVVEWAEPRLFGKAERFNSIVKPAYFLFYLRARRWIRAALAAGQRFDLVHQPLPVAIRYPSPAAGLGLPLLIGPVGGGLDTPPDFLQDQGAQPGFMLLRRLDRLRRRFDPWLRATYRDADCVLGIAEYVAGLLADFPVRRFEVVSETGLDLLPAPIDRSHHMMPVRLLYVGRLVRSKGARDIIRALATIPQSPWVLDVVGEGPDRAACEELVALHGLSNRIIFCGWLSKPKVAHFYTRSDIFVFPSYQEPGGNVTLEAMAHSLPAIVCDRGGPGSATTDNCAIRLPVTTPDALSKGLAIAIQRLVEDKAKRLEMGKSARDHVAKTALWSAKLDRIDALYEDTIKQFRTRAF